MIKLIASDLDGTLLTSKRLLPPEIFPLVEELYKRGILFSPASGRQLESLRRLFAPVDDKVLYIAENGAYVYYRGEELFLEGMPSAAVLRVVAEAAKDRQCHPLICGHNTAYAFESSRDKAFLEECTKYYPHFQIVSTLNEIPKNEVICKVAVFDGRGSSDHSGATLLKALPDFRITVSGKLWCDVSLPKTSKGRAMQMVQERLHFSPDECMAFGDYMNDYEMLLACTHSFVPINGFEPLKQKIGNFIPSNDDLGVIQKIEQLLGEQE